MAYSLQPKKMLALNLLELLRKYSDENHRLSQQELLRLLESEIVLEISDCQAAILPESADIRPGSHRIDDRKLNHGHMDRLHSSG